jgi:DNA polymerase-3 subunit alpha
MTGSVFQFESPGMRNLLTQFKPECFEDLVALVSLYRPGPMDFVPDYINAKWNPSSIHYLCPQLKPILGNTYGTIVYQEQVMRIFQELAGYSLSGADNVRRFMSKKKAEKLAHEREAFVNGDAERGIPGCVANGISAETANELFDQMYSFASYAFNKSHAAAYAMLSYITAWLKYHYPAEYMCAVLNTTDNIDKLGAILGECKEMGIKVLPPTVNESLNEFIVDKDENILFGLNSVKGTKENTVNNILNERTIALFADMTDFINRAKCDKGTMEKLIYAGAFDEFSKNRVAVRMFYEKINPIVERKITVTEKIKEIKAKEEMKKRDVTRLESYEEELDMISQQLGIIKIQENAPENQLAKLIKEKEVMGFFISAHPIDSYKKPSDAIKIADLEAPKRKSFRDEKKIFGIIQNVELKSRKSDNKPMAFFNLDDNTGSIEVMCFTKAYEEFAEYIAENEIVEVYGNVQTDDTLDEENPTLKFSVNQIVPFNPVLDTIAVEVSDIFEINEIRKRIIEDGLAISSGNPLIYYDKQSGLFREPSENICVRMDILSNENYSTALISR